MPAGESEIRISTAIDNRGLTPGMRETSNKIATLTNKFDKLALSIRRQTQNIEDMRKKLDAIGDGEGAVQLAQKIELAEERLRIARNEAELMKNQLLQLQEIKPISEEQFQVQTMTDINDAIDRMIQRENEARAAAEQTASSMDGISSSAENAARSMGSVQYNAEEIQAAMDGITLKSERIPLDFQAIADSVASIVPPIDNATRNMEGMSTKAQSMLATFDRQRLAVENQTVKLYEMKRAYDEMAATEGIDPQKVEEFGFKIESLTEKIRIAAEQANITRSKFMDLIPASVEERAQAFGDRLRNALSAVQSGFSSAVGHAQNFLGTIGNIASKGANAFSRIINGIKNTVSSIIGLNKHTKTSTNLFEKMGNRISRLVVAAFVFNIIRRGLRELQQALGNVLMANEQFAASFNAIKANLLTAFAPIWEIIQPAIISFMAVVARATAILAQFMAMVFGKTFQQAQASAQALNAQSKAFDKTGASAKKAAGALAQFDEINVRTQENAESGAEVGGIDFSAIEEFEMPSWLEEFKNKLLELIPDLEYFYNLGKQLGEWLIKGLQSIPWDSIRAWGVSFIQKLAAFLNGLVDSGLLQQFGISLAEAINTALLFAYTWLTSFNWLNFGKAIGEGLNNMVKTINWPLLGATLAAYFMSFLNTIYGIVTTFNWKNAGESIGRAINRFVQDIDWKKIGVTISEFFKGSLDLMSSAVDKVNWQELGNRIAEAIKGIDFSGITQSIWHLIGSAIGGLAGLVKGAFESVFGEESKEAGNNIALGVVEGIKNFWIGIGTWIKDNIFTPFIEGFKAAFGIESPSKVMMEMGGFIIAGLLQGLKDTFGTVIDFLTGDFFNNWIAAWQKNVDGFGETFSKIKDVTKGIVNGAIDLINRMLQAIASGVNSVIDKINSIKIDVPSWLEKLTGMSSFGFNIPKISMPQIPRLATGGIVDSATVAMIGERGREAVIPLDQDKGALQEIADLISAGMGGGEVVSLLQELINAVREIDASTYLDGREIMDSVDRARKSRGRNLIAGVSG